MKRAASFGTILGVLVIGFAIFASPGEGARAEERVVPQSAAQMRLSFAPVVRKTAPAVVNVYATRLVQQRRVSPFFDDPFFRHFFDEPGFDKPRKRMQKSLGSGVIVSEDGVIVTNHHVIKDADTVRVSLADKREFDCEIVLKDERTDLAVLRILDAGRQKFPFVEVSNSDDLEVGDVVLAIGNPFGVGQTVTQGIVSALARTRVGVTDYQFFIQTDAAINPGNSGGALVDMTGKLVGINTAIYSRSGGSNGIGFAIPSNMARIVINAGLSGGDTVARPWLGASLQAVSSDIAESLGLNRPRGVLVTRVIDGSPAAEAGLLVGDLIVTVDGVTIDDPDTFGYHFVTKGLQGTAKLGILRDGRGRDVKVPLRAAPETVPPEEITLRGYSPFAGVTAVNLSPRLAEQLHVDGQVSGVVVVKVARGSPANRVGIRPGDIVEEINGRAIDSTAALADIANSEPRLWRFTLDRNGRKVRMAFRG